MRKVNPIYGMRLRTNIVILTLLSLNIYMLLSPILDWRSTAGLQINERHARLVPLLFSPLRQIVFFFFLLFFITFRSDASSLSLFAVQISY